MDDLDKVEQRIQELEEYIGVDPNVELEQFQRNDIENMHTKCNRLEDFITIVEDKNFMLVDFFSKTDHLEKLLKNGNKFASQCIDMGKRQAFVMDNQEQITDYASKLKELQTLEQFLQFNPIIGK